VPDIRLLERAACRRQTWLPPGASGGGEAPALTRVKTIRTRAGDQAGAVACAGTAAAVIRCSTNQSRAAPDETGRERECAFELAQAHPGAALFCDRGFWAPEYERTMELIDIELVTPDKHKLGEWPESELAKARIRLVIESVISNLKGPLRQRDHLAKTLRGLIQRIAQRLPALTLGIFINLLTGRPARALVAYDER
jgi:hypothetical protein